MADLPHIRRRLETVNISALARACKIPRTTIASIRDGIASNPGVLTVDAIEKALNEIDAENPPPTERGESPQEPAVGDELPAASESATP